MVILELFSSEMDLNRCIVLFHIPSLLWHFAGTRHDALEHFSMVEVLSIKYSTIFEHSVPRCHDKWFFGQALTL